MWHHAGATTNAATTFAGAFVVFGVCCLTADRRVAGTFDEMWKPTEHDTSFIKDFIHTSTSSG
jgi:hypothetical protein